MLVDGKHTYLDPVRFSFEGWPPPTAIYTARNSSSIFCIIKLCHTWVEPVEVISLNISQGTRCCECAYHVLFTFTLLLLSIQRRPFVMVQFVLYQNCWSIEVPSLFSLQFVLFALAVSCSYICAMWNIYDAHAGPLVSRLVIVLFYTHIIESPPARLSAVTQYYRRLHDLQCNRTFYHLILIQK